MKNRVFTLTIGLFVFNFSLNGGAELPAARGVFVSANTPTTTTATIKEGVVNLEETQIQSKARKRIYPGGRDEESLRVQMQMARPLRKMGPATEAPEPPEPSSSTSAED